MCAPRCIDVGGVPVAYILGGRHSRSSWMSRRSVNDRVAYRNLKQARRRDIAFDRSV